MMRIKAVTTIIMVLYAGKDIPDGVGNKSKIIPSATVNRNHFFWVTQKRKLIKDWFEKPSISSGNLG
jgi:hypothetical protein